MTNTDTSSASSAGATRERGTAGTVVMERWRWQGWAPLPVNRGGHDEADRNRRRPDDDRQRDVLPLADLHPQVVRRELVDDDEAEPEHDHADQRVEEGAEEDARL